METPILTIAMPSYNVEAYIDRALESLSDPRLAGKVEVLIVNDGSTDATRGMALRFVDRHPEIFKVIDKENGGHGSAINAGIAHATGRYFRVVDGDDWVDAENLIALIDILECSEADLVVDVRCDVDMQTMKPTIRPLPDSVFVGATVAFDDICCDEEKANVITIHTMNVKTALLRSADIRLLEKTFYVDYEYIAKVASIISSVQFVDLNVYKYLVGNACQSVADASYVKRWDDHTRVTEKMLAIYAAAAPSVSDARRDYLKRRAELIVNTHYNIALIFDPDRKRGVKRAHEFRAFLKERYPDFAASGQARYRQAKILHYMGVDSQKKLDKITGKSSTH